MFPILILFFFNYIKLKFILLSLHSRSSCIQEDKLSINESTNAVFAPDETSGPINVELCIIMLRII